MTCIVGLVNGGKVYMGGDSAGVGGLDLTVRADQKVFRNGDMLFGFTTSFRMGQLLRFSLTPPAMTVDQDVYQYMCTSFVDAVRSCLKNGGYARTDNGEESGGTFLVGYKGRIFAIHSDYQVAESSNGYASIGCGAQIAHGALFASVGQDPAERVRIALEAAERHSAGVRRPFHIEVLETPVGPHSLS